MCDDDDDDSLDFRFSDRPSFDTTRLDVGVARARRRSVDFVPEREIFENDYFWGSLPRVDNRRIF
jgi:hypothetical protein